MGLKGVCSLITKLAPKSITTHELAFYSKSVIAIDTSILLYRYSYHPNSDLILCFARLCIKYLDLNIKPVFVFEGPPPKCKSITLTKRFDMRQNIKAAVLLLEKDPVKNKEKILKLKKKLIKVYPKERERVFKFLESAGFDVFTSPSEAETMCAYLQSEKIVDYTYTDDYDALALGCDKVLRNFKKGNFDQINMEIVLNSLKLTKKQFTDMCILCGCDYCPTIPRIGYVNAYKLIMKHKNIENILLENTKDNVYKIPENYNFKEAREAFNDFSIFKKVKLKDKIIFKNDLSKYKIDTSVLYKLKSAIIKYNTGK